VRRVFRRWREKFSVVARRGRSSSGADDIADVGRKVPLRHLAGEDVDAMKTVPAGSVLVLRRLLPSDVVAPVRGVRLPPSS